MSRRRDIISSDFPHLWHAYRRKWATARKHLPDPYVAAAGGWTNSNTLRQVYQQADQETMLRGVLDGGTLREARYADVVPTYTTNVHSPEGFSEHQPRKAA